MFAFRLPNDEKLGFSCPPLVVDRMTEAEVASSVAVQLAETLRETESRIAVAETCTGGQLCSLLTDVPGASEFFEEGFVPYAYDSLRTRLAIDREALDSHGVVSAPITRQLARRARDIADVSWSLATTGIAGPSGGSPDKPIGTAFISIAYAGPWETQTSSTTVTRHEFDGDRKEIKNAIALTAIEELHEQAKTQRKDS